MKDTSTLADTTMIKANKKEKEMMEQIEEQLSKIAEQYGCSIPKMIAINNSKVIISNLSIYKGDYKSIMRKSFVDMCNLGKLNLKIEWLDKWFFLESANTKVTIIGIDFDGGSNVIRVIDSIGNEFNIHHQRVEELI